MRRREFIKSGAILCLSSMSMVLIGCDVNQKIRGVTAPYPSKPITMIVPYSAGGSADTIARNMEKFSIKYFGQPFITTNKPGGGGILAWNDIAEATHDGYKIGLVGPSALLNPLYGQTKYHYPTALEPLVQITCSPDTISVLADSPWQTIDDLVEYAKKHPGELKYAHPGLGTPSHVVGEMFIQKAAINIAQVPFQGDGESLAALLGGHVQLMISMTPAVKEYIISGKVKAIANSGEQRLNDPIFNNVPTFKERGLDVVFYAWWGVGAPKMVPIDVRESLEGKLSAIVNDPEFKSAMEKLGMPVDYLGPDDFKKKWNDETVRLAKIVQDTGIVAKIASQKN